MDPSILAKKLKAIREEGFDMVLHTAKVASIVMSCLIWNARGLGNQRAIRKLHRLLDESNPSLVFISETKLVATQCNWWRRKFRLDGLLVMNCDRRCGGLVLLWREPFEVHIQSYSASHIDCIVYNGCQRWRFTGFYGNSVSALHHHSWQLLKHLSSMHELISLSWLVGGDFNEILFDYEKRGGISRNLKQMSDFVDVIYDSGLQDMPFAGDSFTWCNRRGGEETILARLDRFFCSAGWNLNFPDAEVKHLEFYGSDHRALIMSLKNPLRRNTNPGYRRFTFEHKWLLDEDFEGYFSHKWAALRSNISLPDSLRCCSSDLKMWAGNRFDHLRRKIKNLR
ncbi:uncharacterized protein LOC142524991 [Primulina tabacum]|uniref:uncharacterized protein LOC142524991 n=1 Tax=Primulina tabacum TaxID=48773 RepID=UPI003F59FDB9